MIRESLPQVAGVKIDQVKLGEIGRKGDTETQDVNTNIARMIPELEKWIESGELEPMEYKLVDGVGFGPVLKGLEGFQGRKSDGKKLVIRIATD